MPDKSNWVWLGGLFGLVVCGGLLIAQQPTKPATGQPSTPGAASPEKLTLEELIGRALKENPDVRVAEAKVKEAEAELTRARMAAAQKVISFHGSLAAARHQVEEAEEKLTAMRGLHASKVASQAELKTAETALAQKKSELSRLEAELPYLLGQGQAFRGAGQEMRLTPYMVYPSTSYDTFRTPVEVIPWKDATLWLGHHSIDATAQDKIRKALNTALKIEVKDKSIGEVLDLFKEKMGVPFLDQLPGDVKSQKVSLALSEPVPTGAALQALSDLTGLKFAVREYGIFVTKGDLPSGSMPLHSFWRSMPTTTKSPSGPAPKP